MMKTESLETCIEYFFTEVWASCPFEGRKGLLKQRGTFLMSRVVEAKLKDLDNERLPSISRCMQVFHELDNLSLTKCADAIMSLILAVDAIGKVEKNNTGAEARKKALEKKQVLLHDIVDSWIVYHRHCLAPNKTAFRFPNINKQLLNTYGESNDLLRALGLMFPRRYLVNSKVLPAVAIASFVILTDPHHTSLDIQQKAKPLLQPLGQILATVFVRQETLRYLINSYPDVLKYVLRRWKSVVTQLRQTNDPYVVEGTETIAKNPSSSTVIQNQVTAALKMGDVEAIESAWRQLWGTEVRPDGDRTRELKGNQELFHYFITAFTAFHRPQRSVDVWDSMVSIGIKPTLKTWTALIEGCRRSKNAIGLENVWKKLIATGAELDDAVWSARIVGLVDCRQPEAGLRALDEMLRLSKLKPDDPAVAKLTRKIVSVNAAVAALIRINAMSAATKVLAWASENGIEPDLTTYNTLLRPMVQQGNAEQVDCLLKMMKEQDVQPDAATFTVLLDGLIGSTKDDSPDEQVQMVTRLFSDMEAAGVQANMETFARMMHLLLCAPEGDSSAAVDAIRGFIRKKGLKASPYIYTILTEHYFSQTPPNLKAIDDLMKEGGYMLEDGSLQLVVLEHGRRGLDRVFWERMIKGYATVGEVDQAYRLFGQISNLGSALTMDTLEILLRALVGARRFDEARRTVEIVVLHRQRSDVYGTANTGAFAEADGGEGARIRGRHWRHGFWAFAMECGFVSMEALRRLELGIRVGAAPDTEKKAS